MQARFMCGALVALAGSLAAQAPVAPTVAPKVKGPSKAEFRVGGIMVQGERNYDFLGSIGTATGTIKGVEVLLRGSGAGLYVRSMSGEFGTQPIVVSADARLLLGRPGFTIFAGVGRRGLKGLKDKVYDMVQGGVSSTLSIGGTGLRTHISGNIILATEKDEPGGVAASVKNASKGIEGEAAIFYRLPKTPFFLNLGYRTEVFNAVSGNNDAPEEVRGLRLGAGLQFGGR